LVVRLEITSQVSFSLVKTLTELRKSFLEKLQATYPERMTSSLLYGRYAKICLTVVIAMMTFHSAESAVNCYDCTVTAGLGSSNCVTVNSETPKKTCDSCSAYIAKSANSATRGCGISTILNTGCQGTGGVQICSFACNTDLCNNQNAAQLSNMAGSITILLTLVSVILVNKIN